MSATSSHSVAAALSYVATHGVVLASAKGRAPRLIDMIAGEQISGHWWSHPRANEIYNVLSEVQDSPEVLVCRLLRGKITLVHRRLWPALARVAYRFAPAQIAKVTEVHTDTGRHETREIAFPLWLPTDLLEEASAMPESKATEILQEYFPSTPTRKRQTRGRAGNDA